MSTQAQDAANYANAQLSTGPRTVEGKIASSLNSLKHGLTAKTVLLPGEDPAEFNALATAMIKDLAPRNSIQEGLVRELTELQWRLHRVSRLEAAILAADSPDFKALNNISLHAARMKRQFSATLKELLHLIQLSSQENHLAIQQAAIIRAADRLLHRSTDLAAFGFVLTTQEIDRWLELQGLIEESRRAVIGISEAAPKGN